mgnify:CR=1 FL=1
MIKKIVFVFTLFALNSSINLMAQVPENAEDISPLLIGERFPEANLIDV